MSDSTPSGPPRGDRLTPDGLALYDALGPDDRAAAARLLEADPELAEAFASWRSLRAGVRQQVGEALPDRALLVLHALADVDGALTPDERSHLDAAGLEDALDRHPGLALAARRVRDDRDAFEAAWAEGTSDEASPTAARDLAVPAARPVPATRAADRAAVQPPRAPAARRAGRWVWRSAALAAVVAFAALSTWMYQRDAGYERVVADADRSLVLPDGSVADLAAGAVLLVPTGDRDPRHARLLEGTALFQVVPDPESPFRLETTNAEVLVLGTTFGVEASEVQTEVALVAGSVSLAPRRQPGAAVRLAPGESSTVLAADAPSAPAPTPPGGLGQLEPSAGPAGAVAERIAERFGVEVEVAPALRGEIVAGRFDDEATAADAFRVLALALGAEVDSTGGAYRLTEGE